MAKSATASTVLRSQETISLLLSEMKSILVGLPRRTDDVVTLLQVPDFA
jgi:hypothetical protein